MNHAQIAKDLFTKGYNCAQSVFIAFCDLTGYEEKEAAHISSSFGGGMGRLREVCGAVSGAFMVAGCLYGYDDEADKSAKTAHYALIQDIARRFTERNGTIICRDLIGEEAKDKSAVPTDRTQSFYKRRPCVQMVIDAAQIMDEIIAEKGLNK